MKTRAVKLAVVVLLGFGGSAGAATAPVVPPTVASPASASPGDFANKPINWDKSIPETTSTKDVEIAPPSGGLGTTKVVFSLAGVLGLIFLLRWLMTKVAPGMAGHRDTRAMKVLSRCVIAPRQHLLLIQVGRRLVMVGEAGSQLNALCQITEPEEVSALLQQIGEDRTVAASRFTSIFGKAKKEFEEDEIGDSAEDIAAPNRDIAPSEAEVGASDESVDPAIEATREELAGLSDKVRGLARQLGEQH